MFTILFASKIYVDLPVNRMECYFAMIESASELAGSYSIEASTALNTSFIIMSNKNPNVFDSSKSTETFVVPAPTPGVYRLCFTTLSHEYFDKDNKPLKFDPSKLFFELNVLPIEKSATDRLGAVLG